MIRILFVCHGNICRSPMAEFIMRELVEKKGVGDDFYIESAATSTEEIGNGVYPPVRRILAKRGIDTSKKHVRQITNSDYGKFDYIVGMDKYNLRNMRRIMDDTQGKISLLMDYTPTPRDVADPWYTDDFETTLKDVTLGCECLFEHITSSKNK
ncbi:MAG: low molecular weight phosphotyrosine protein phosphatase [Clostridiales bacterium]|nr:low molecular weight phosphotyrosine protein phosphatase [Clostridiales bacterium]